jgi:hypothetical protein
MKKMSLPYPMPESFISDSKGNKTHVILKIEDYEKMLEDIEDLEDLHDINERKKNPDYVDFEEVKKNLEL